jgi:PUA domain protein
MPVLRHLKDKEAKQIVREFVIRFPVAREKLDFANHLQELVVDNDSVIFADGIPILIRRNDLWIPSLKFQIVLDSLPKIIVDMGAIPHVTNGAQIMRPGIKLISDAFSKGDFVVIQDERFRKAIAVGIADLDSETMQAMLKGKAITNLHYVGDEYWNSFGTSRS